MNDQWKTCSAEGCGQKARTKGATVTEMPEGALAA
jgi:hypothetical protein